MKLKFFQRKLQMKSHDILYCITRNKHTNNIYWI
jgi:hypothetical protein